MRKKKTAESQQQERGTKEAIRLVCAELRESFADLYELPYEHFRGLVAPAVRLGIRCGDFKDYGTLTLAKSNTRKKNNNNDNCRSEREMLAEAQAVELIL